MIFADLVFHPGSIAVWIFAGLVIGWLAAKAMENPSYGIIGDLLLGSIGAVAGGAVVAVLELVVPTGAESMTVCGGVVSTVSERVKL